VRLLLTGAGGLLGGGLCRSLAASGHEITSIIRKPGAGLFEAGHQVCELSDSPSVEALFTGMDFDAVVHCAAAIRQDESVDFYRDNVAATINLMKHAKKACVPRFLNMSTVSVYMGAGPFDETSALDTTGMYPGSKVCGELVLQLNASDIFRVLTLRLSGLHGGSRTGGVVRSMIDAAMTGSPILVSEPATKISISFLEDVQSGVEKLLQSNWHEPWSLYNLASPEPCSLAEMAQFVVQESCSKSTIEYGEGALRNRCLDVRKLLNDYGLSPWPTKKRLTQIISDARR
jgi:2-alkyl-3-oxoalkanoate reductase